MSKIYSQIPVHIVEYHNEALEHIYRAIGSKHLPLGDILLLHFDAHPDMIIPDLDADDFFEKNKLFESLSIENWIVPSLYAGHVNTVVWFKAPWANQMAEQTVKFLIGREKSSSKVKVTSKDDYFLSECLYCSEKELENTKEINFHVETCCENLNDTKLLFFNKLVDGKSYILDIDLDFFSTKNPIKEMFSDKDYKTLKLIYEFWPPRTRSDEDIQQCLDKREKKLKNLKKMLKVIENEMNGGRNLRRKTGKANYGAEDDRQCKKPKLITEEKDDDPFLEKEKSIDALQVKELTREASCKDGSLDDSTHKEDEAGTGKRDVKTLDQDTQRLVEGNDHLETENIKVKREVGILMQEEDMFTFESLKGIYTRMKDVANADLLHDFGCTCDDPELPHHVSTDCEVDELLESVERYLRCMNHPPTIVTISRSSEDEYCPSEQVETIQEKVGSLLRKIYGNVDVVHHYKEES